MPVLLFRFDADWTRLWDGMSEDLPAGENDLCLLCTLGAAGEGDERTIDLGRFDAVLDAGVVERGDGEGETAPRLKGLRR